MAGIQDKVARLLSRERGRPALKPTRPLVLKDEVSNRRMKRGEMSLLMACWKQHEFNNALCSSEVSAFYRCVENAQTERRNQAKNLALGQGGRLLPKQANKLLKRHPNLTREI
ncbi:coiled-coil-helix-coiled-coil-helix domain-containing protein 1 isoform X2 [Electrophorus electricus]|uniref:coiled-coil-helix-coiled-coil-helix domain-containing protein 1 isoform X2 n=1 Tax=Electrophorus electricus TaxID=8005 RepID=UPI0015CF8B8C|nr:coiled-coil-helix-coiled-coil-helix domain-containing protein 1 isoform X2 [Electrophorus electricus]